MTGAVMFLPHTDMTASALPSTAGGSTSDPTPALSGLVTTTASDAIGAVTYAWTQTGGDSMVIQNPASAATRFSGSLSGPGETIVGTFVCTVTDAAGQVAVTNTVTVTLSWL